MSEEKLSLHIDTDWKKQAQEEKRKLAEQEKQKAAAVPAPSASAGAAASGARTGSAPGPRGGREMPAPSFAALVQSIATQVFFYLGDLAPRGTEPQLNLDMAKYQIDLLTILEQKTVKNLMPDEQRLLDAALYETRMRFVSVSSQIVNG
jgi:hypothetical protein